MLDQYTKKWILLIKTSEYITTFIKSLWKSDIRASVKLFWILFSIKLFVDLKKHIVRSMFYFQIINFKAKSVK